MAKDFESLKQQALVIKNEVEDGANSSERVGGMLEDIVESMKLGTTEFNVSAFFPTGGTNGSNKYDLSTAIGQVPAELRTAGVKVSFLNESGNVESWEFSGGSWTVGRFSQVGAGKLTELEKKFTGVLSLQGNYLFSYISNYQDGYIENGGKQAGDVVNLTPIVDERFKCAIIDVEYGKVYGIKGVASGNKNNLYSFIDDENKLISGYTADPSLDARYSEVYLTPPVNAKKLICNFLIEGNPYSVSVSTDILTKFNEYESKIESNDIVSDQFFENPAEWIKGEYIKGSSGIIDISTTVENNLTEYTIQDAKEGDMFVVKGKGSVNARLYIFIDSNNEVLSVSPENAEGTFIITAPINTAKLICNGLISGKSILRKANDLFLSFIVKPEYQLGFFRDSGYGISINDITSQNGFYCIKKEVKAGEHYKINAKIGEDSTISAFVLTDENGIIYYRSLQGDIKDVIVDIRQNGTIYLNSNDNTQIGLEKVELSEPYREKIRYSNIEWKNGKLEDGFFNKITETTDYHYTGLLPIQPNTDYVFNISLKNGSHICFFDESKKLIWVVDNQMVSYSNSYTDNIRVKTPYMAKYVQLCNATSSRAIDNNPIIYLDNTTFSAYRRGLLQKDGTIMDYYYHVTDWIPVYPGEKWIYTGALKNGAYICFYTRNRQIIPSANITGDDNVTIESTSVTPWETYIEITIPSDAYWMICCSRFGGKIVYRKKQSYEFKYHKKYDGYIDKYDDMPYNGTYEVSGDEYSIINGAVYMRGDIVKVESGNITSKHRECNISFNGLKNYDVCIIGAGAGGIGAAYALRDSGLNVCMINREDRIGGTVVNAGIYQLLPTTAPAFLKEVIESLVKDGFAVLRGTGNYNDTFASYVNAQEGTYSAENSIDIDKYAYSDKVYQDISDNIDIFLNAKLVSSVVEDGYVKSIELNTSFGRISIKADVFIDCSGGELCMLCNNSDGGKAVINDGYYIGTDPKSLFNEDNIPDGYQGNKYAINTPEMNYKVAKGEEDLSNIDDSSIDSFRVLVADSQYPILSTYLSNFLGVSNESLVDNGYDESYNKACKIMKARWKYTKEKCSPVYDSYKYLEPNKMIGIRELYRIHCENMMVQSDLSVRIDTNNLGNNIACCTWFVDLHGSEGVNNYKNIPVTNCGIPYQSLIPKYLKNVLVACRALGTSHIANACVRLTKTMMMVGNAAGYAVEDYIKNSRTDFRDVDVSYIQDKTKLAEQAKFTNDLLDAKLVE